MPETSRLKWDSLMNWAHRDRQSRPLRPIVKNRQARVLVVNVGARWRLKLGWQCGGFCQASYKMLPVPWLAESPPGLVEAPTLEKMEPL